MKHIIPTWLFYTCLIIFSLGVVQVFFGDLYWGLTSEKDAAIILTFTCSFIILFDMIGTLMKHKIKIVD